MSKRLNITLVDACIQITQNLPCMRRYAASVHRIFFLEVEIR